MLTPYPFIFIALWQFILAFVELGLGGSLIVLSAFPSYSGSGKSFDSMAAGEQIWLVIFILLWLCFMALAVAGGIGLLLKRGHKWARTFSMVNSALSLFFIPLGTIIGILSIIYLTKSEVVDHFNSQEAIKMKKTNSSEEPMGR